MTPSSFEKHLSELSVYVVFFILGILVYVTISRPKIQRGLPVLFPVLFPLVLRDTENIWVSVRYALLCLWVYLVLGHGLVAYSADETS